MKFCFHRSTPKKSNSCLEQEIQSLKDEIKTKTGKKITTTKSPPIFSAVKSWQPSINAFVDFVAEPTISICNLCLFLEAAK